MERRIPKLHTSAIKETQPLPNPNCAKLVVVDHSELLLLKTIKVRQLVKTKNKIVMQS